MTMQDRREVSSIQAYGRRKITLRQRESIAIISALDCLTSCAEIIVNGYQYRANLREMVNAIKVSNTRNMDKARIVLQLLDNHSGDIPKVLRNNCYMAVLRLLTQSENYEYLLPPPR